VKDVAAKILNSSYEVVAVLVPGLLSLAALAFPLLLLVQLSGLSVLPSSFPSDPNAALCISIMTLAYLYGRLLQASVRAYPECVKEFLSKRSMRVRLFLLDLPSGPSIGGDWEPQWKSLCGWLSLPRDATWKQFYLTARARLQQSEKTSLLPTFQGKYTLNRSLARGLGIAIWVEAFAGVGETIIAEATALCSASFENERPPRIDVAPRNPAT